MHEYCTFRLLHGIGKSKVKPIEKVLHIKTQGGFQNVLHHMTTSEPEITVQSCPEKKNYTTMYYCFFK